MELDKRLERGSNAQFVLDNEIYLESYEILKMEITTQWQQSPARDSEGREKLHLMIGLVDKLKAIMQTIMETGMLAKKDLQHHESMLEKAKAYLR